MEGWIILRCAGRSTLRLAETLAEDGFEVWTPVEVVKVIVPGGYRKRRGKYALTSGYAFARGCHDHDLLRLSSADHRHPPFSLFMDDGAIAYVSDAVIEGVREAEFETHALAVPRKKISPYSRGAKVSVRKGIYAGVHGEVERSDGKIAKVWLSLFGRHQRIELPVYYLQDEEKRKAA